MDNLEGPSGDGATVTDVTDSRTDVSQHATVAPGAGPDVARDVASDAGPDPVTALRDLAATLESVCEDLFASVPFIGDQDTGYALNHYVDETVAALRAVHAEADDLLRAMAVAEQHRGLEPGTPR